MSCTLGKSLLSMIALLLCAICFRYNLSQVEQWLRERRLHDGGALEVMEPMIEATQLLQARKTDADVTSICDMCAHLSTSQVRYYPSFSVLVKRLAERASPK